MSERPLPPDGDDGGPGGPPTVENPFANLPKPRPGLEIHNPIPDSDLPASAPGPLAPGSGGDGSRDGDAPPGSREA